MAHGDLVLERPLCLQYEWPLQLLILISDNVSRLSGRNLQHLIAGVGIQFFRVPCSRRIAFLDLVFLARRSESPAF